MELDAATLERLVRMDPDRVRAAQLAAPADRDALMVLYAFHAELAKVPEMVSQPLIGSIRYQWWRDALEEIFSGKATRKHEIVQPLARMIAERNVPRFWLDRLIDARERDLDPRPFDSVSAATDYAEATSGTLLNLAVKVAGGEDTDSMRAMGAAWGLIGLARAFRFYKGSMLQNVDQAALVDAATEAYGRTPGKIDAAIIPAVAYVGFVPLYAKQMSRTGHNATKDSVELGAVRKQARLMRVALQGKL